MHKTRESLDKQQEALHCFSVREKNMDLGYAIQILKEQVISDSVDLTYAIDSCDKAIEERQRERLNQLQDAINLLGKNQMNAII